MGQLGLLGMTTPEDYGGSDIGAVAYACVLEEIAAGDGACSTILSVHNSVGCGPIVKFGTEEQKQRFLPKLASGEWVGGFALTEPQAGSDASALLTRAKRDGDAYVLSGTKQFITSGKNGNVIIVFAVTDPAAGKKGISAFIVPTDTPGYKVVRVEEKLGQHSSDTCQIAFDDMRLPADLRLGEEGEGYRIALSNLEGGRVGIAVAIGRHGARRLRGRARLCARAHHLRQAHRRASGHRLPPRQHGDRDRGGPATGPSRGAIARSRIALPDGSLDGQALRLGNGRTRLFGGDPDFWRRRLHRRLSRRADLSRRPRLPDL